MEDYCDHCDCYRELFHNDNFGGSLCEECDKKFSLSLGQKVMKAADVLLVIGQTVCPIPEGTNKYAISDSFRSELSEGEVSVECNFYTSPYYLHMEDEDEASKLAAEMSHDRLKQYRKAIGGRWTKDYQGSYLRYTQTIDGVEITLECDRAATCRKIVTEVKEIPAKKIPAKIIPARTEEVYEWECN